MILRYVLTCLFFSSCFSAVITDWSLPVATVEGKEAHIAIDQSGKDMIFIVKDKSQRIFSVYSNNYGRTWVRSTNSIGKGFNPAMALSKDGKTAVCVWEDFNTNNIIASYSMDLGQSWHESSSTPLGKGYLPSLSINDDATKVICAWEDSFSPNICIASSTDQGLAWKFESTIEKARHPSIAQTSSGSDVICAYKSDLNNEIYSVYSRDGGKNWSYPDSIGKGYCPSVVLDKDGGAICTFTDIDKKNICSACSQSLGDSWSNPSGITRGTLSSLALSQDGEVAVCMCQDQDQLRTCFSSDFGSTWEICQNIKNSSNPSAAVSSDGTKAVCLFIDQNEMVNASFWPYSVLSVSSKQTRNVYKKDIVNEIYWEALKEAKLYKIYTDPALSNIIYQGTDLKFYDYGIKKGDKKAYYIVWIDENGKQSPPVVISVPGLNYKESL